MEHSSIISVLYHIQEKNDAKKEATTSSELATNQLWLLTQPALARAGSELNTSYLLPAGS